MRPRGERGDQAVAAWHDEIRYHADDASWRACEACAGWSDGPPDHENGMHVGTHVPGCAACEARGF